MTDLTERLLTAASRGATHELGPLVDSLSEQVRGHGITVDWDDGAGEDWARVFDHSAFMAIIWRRGPFAIALTELPAPVATWLEKSGLDVLRVPSFDTPSFRLERSAVPVVMGADQWPEDEVPLEGMSIRDLWWATV